MNIPQKTNTGENTAISDNNCPLCVRHQKTRKYHEDQYVWIVECLKCECPLIVWKEHKHYLEPKELSYVWEIIKKIFGNEATHALDTNMKTMSNHWHGHIGP